MVKKIAISGLGRTGRCFFRAGILNKDFSKSYQVTAFNDLAEARTIANFLKYDSVHGTFDAEVSFRDKTVIVNGREISCLSVSDPALLPWKEMAVDIVVESTGKFTERADAEKHLKAGAKKVLISAPGKKPDVTLVPGVNEKAYDPQKHNIVSGASCTTNCIAPMAKVLLNNFGMLGGFMTTVHAYTNDQRLLDLMHKDLRRGRAANVSIIPTTTGAAVALGLVIPELDGRMDGMALRVPVPDGSITDLVAALDKDVTKEEVNEAYKRAAEKDLKGILDYTEDPIVSADIVGNPHSCIIDGLSTMVIRGKSKYIKVLGWYDNEWGYASRLCDMVRIILG